MSDKKESLKSVSRRNFIKGIGTTTVSVAMTTATAGAQDLAAQLEKLNKETIHGPDPVSLKLSINGKVEQVDVAPSETLLDVLRNHLPYTGSKEVCGRASCGACTVLLDGKPVYGCMKLAIEAQGHAIETVEGLASEGSLSDLQQAFVEEDGLMCGYCTSGFLMSLTVLLKEKPKPSMDEIKQACSGHLCRCGTYPRVYQSALRAAGISTDSQTQVITWSLDNSHG